MLSISELAEEFQREVLQGCKEDETEGVIEALWKDYAEDAFENGNITREQLVGLPPWGGNFLLEGVRQKGLKVVAVGPNCFGIGKDVDEAISFAEENWPSWAKPRRPSAKHFTIWVTDGDIEVSTFDGSLTSTGTILTIQKSILAEEE